MEAIRRLIALSSGKKLSRFAGQIRQGYYSGSYGDSFYHRRQRDVSYSLF
uniref:Uncharacterized protein n=1 Tax=Utricularia reniformis TaxID=192314 RepID=A0A1Y0B4C4_9LAMI|nr:hypothetical protein AEK19_MT2082 [Utricularia reniformis]ART32237.1 hypothetical protein AEK19_MT2082 [Utricularia reniformis]